MWNVVQLYLGTKWTQIQSGVRIRVRITVRVRIRIMS